MENGLQTMYMAECVSSLSKAGCRIRGIVTDNHSSNVSACKRLKQMFAPEQGTHDSPLYIQHPDTQTKTYLFFLTTCICIRNNLLNAKKFVFPEFSFSCLQKTIASKERYIAWGDLKKIYNQDCSLSAHLRRVYKLTMSALYRYKNKQNVNLALVIFNERTIVAAKRYISERSDCSSFLTLIYTWWSIVNAKTQFCANAVAHAIVVNDGKIEFLLLLQIGWKSGARADRIFAYQSRPLML